MGFFLKQTATWRAKGAPRGASPKIKSRIWTRLGSQNRQKAIKNRCQDAIKFCISFFDRFWGPFGHHFEAMLGIMLGIGDIAKIIKNLQVFNEFSWFGGSKLESFSYVFGVSVSRSFFDHLGVGLGVDFGAVWVPKWGLC